MNLNPSRTESPAPEGAGAAEVAAALSKHPFLQGFSRPQVDQLVPFSRLREHRSGDVIFKQGDPAHTFYLIEWGTVALTHAGLKRNTAIQTLSAGDVLGWSWLFPPFGWQFNAMATDPTRLIEIDGEQVRRICREQHDFGYEFMSRIAQVVIERLQHSRRKLFKLAGGI